MRRSEDFDVLKMILMQRASVRRDMLYQSKHRFWPPQHSFGLHLRSHLTSAELSWVGCQCSKSTSAAAELGAQWSRR